MASKRPVTCHIIGQMVGELPKILLIYTVVQTDLTIIVDRFKSGPEIASRWFKRDLCYTCNDEKKTPHLADLGEDPAPVGGR